MHHPIRHVAAKEARDQAIVATIEIEGREQELILRVVPEAGLVPRIVRLDEDGINELNLQAVMIVEWRTLRLWVQLSDLIKSYHFEGIL